MRYRDRIRLDRYAKKDYSSAPKQGDLVVVSVERESGGRRYISREIGVVEKASSKNATVKIANSDETITLPHSSVDVVVEKTYDDICRRVGEAVVKAESEQYHDDTEIFKEEIIADMINEKFIPAGRIQAGMGLDQDLTLFNCYVFPISSDSRSGISNHWARLFETYSRGGGVGWNLSILRPKGATVKKVNGRSSGAVSWAEQFSQIAGAVEQGGSRRGAGLQAMWCWHPDILDFVTVKAKRKSISTPNGNVYVNENLLSNTNISVLLSDSFMRAVENDDTWDLVFPDLDDPEYDDLWNGSLEDWLSAGKTVKVYDTIQARFLWKEIIQNAWESGEPGIIFMDHANNMSNSYYYARLIASNPCGEQMLPANGVCNLSHLNLAKFIKPVGQFPNYERTFESADLEFNWDDFKSCIHNGIRFLDDVIDLNKYHEKVVEDQQTNERRIGLGFLGYGDALMRLGLRYGSEAALQFTEKLVSFFKQESYKASINLAKLRGPFPLFKPRKYVNSGFLRKQDEEIRALIRKYGIRNVTVNTVAPTGSVAALLNTSSGCEPFFALSYTSNTRIGLVDETASVTDILLDKFGKDESKWPSYVVTAQNGISTDDHIHTMSVIQKHIDASISKTVNMPNNATVDDVARAYTLMWKLGCKGGTVYRDGSRDEQVLYTNKDKNDDKKEDYITDTNFIRPRPDAGISVTFSEESPIGTVHATIRHDPESGDPIDLFVTLGKGDASADAEAIGRLISIILRWPNGKTINQHTRLEMVRDQLVDILGRGQVGFGPHAKRSMPDTLAKILDQYLSGDFPLAALPFGTRQVEDLLAVLKDPALHETVKDILLLGTKNNDKTATHNISIPYDYCPKCSNHTLVVIPNKCDYCETCGYTRC